MKNIQTDIIIKNDVRKVWEILTDFKKYPLWNPFLIKVEQTSKDRLKIEACLSYKNIMKFSSKIIVLTSPSELRWIGGVPWIFQGEHYFSLKPLSCSETHLIHGENFSGSLAILSWPFMKKKIHNNFLRMNLALKERCEN